MEPNLKLIHAGLQTGGPLRRILGPGITEVWARSNLSSPADIKCRYHPQSLIELGVRSKAVIDPRKLASGELSAAIL